MTTIDNIMALAEILRTAATRGQQEDAREVLHTALTEVLAKDVSFIDEGNNAQPVWEPANWYCIDKTGMATLCADEADALQNAKLAAMDWPNNAPYRAVQLVEAQPVQESLTPEHIERIYKRYGGDMINCTKAIERAHGIGSDK
jgi:hypothetical protein